MAVVLSDIVEDIAKAVKLTRPEARVVADRILDSIAEGLSRGEDFEIRNFGTFKTRVVSGKVGRHLSTGATVVLPPMRKVSFKAGKFLKPITTGEEPRSREGRFPIEIDRHGAPGSIARLPLAKDDLGLKNKIQDKTTPPNEEAKSEPLEPKTQGPVTSGNKPKKAKRTPFDGEQTTLWGV